MISKRIIEYFSDSPHFFNFKKEFIPSFQTDNDLVSWITTKSGWPYFPLVLPDAPYKTMLIEALSIEDMFIEHRSDESENSHKGWKSVCIHGESWNRTNTWKSYKDNEGKKENDIVYKWCPEICERCPETARYFKEKFVHCNFQRLRFMWLDPQGYIQPHSDMPNINLLGPINISLNYPQGCNFKMKDYGYIPFSNDGNACILNIGIEHSVWNNSDTPRIHIISHGTPNQNFNRIVLNSLEKLL